MNDRALIASDILIKPESATRAPSLRSLNAERLVELLRAAGMDCELAEPTGDLTRCESLDFQ